MALRNRQASILLPMRVWDLPIRLFHWIIVLLIPALYVSVKTGHPVVHMAFGYAMLALLLFRLAWGVIGSDTARFNRFLVSPVQGLQHLRRLGLREPDTQVGHNAAGGWMVLLLLLLLAIQVGTGLFSRNKEGIGGALWPLLDPATAHDVLNVHGFNFWLIAAAIGVHVAVVGVYVFVKGQDIVRPMVTGKKRLPAATRAPRMASRLLALALLLAAAAIAAGIATLA